MKQALLTLAAGCAVLTAADRATAQSFINGSFEQLAPGQFVNGGDDKMTVTAAPGWSISGTGSPDWMFGPGLALWDTNWGSYFQLGGAFDPALGVGGTMPPGGFNLFREGVTQVVSGFTPGNAYRVDFSHTRGFVETPLVIGPAGGWELFIDTVSVKEALSTNVIGPVFPLPHTTDWQTSSHTFQATSATHRFDFVSYVPVIGQGATIQWLDNVSVSLVPEPASAGLLALGLGLALTRTVRNAAH